MMMYPIIRVTLIKSDGTVIYDNEADTTTMENHFERPEVKQAVTYGNGSSSPVIPKLLVKKYIIMP